MRFNFINDSRGEGLRFVKHRLHKTTLFSPEENVACFIGKWSARCERKHTERQLMVLPVNTITWRIRRLVQV